MRRYFLALCALGLVSIPACAASRWVEVRSPHFIVYTDSDELAGRRTAGELERMRAFFQVLLPNAAIDADVPITVFAVEDEKGMDSFVPTRTLAKGQARVAGYFLPVGDRNYIVMELDAHFPHPYAVVYHEYTHFVLRKDYSLPLWLNEGMAQYFQNTDIDKSEVAFGQPDFNEIFYLKQRMQLLPLPVLFAVDRNSPYYHEEDKSSVFYVESWALTHLLESADFQNRTRHIAEYDHRLKSGESSVDAARRAFGDLDELQKRLAAYVAQLNYQGIQIKMNFNIDDKTFETPPVSADEVEMARADLLAHVGRGPEARALAEGVLAHSPNNAAAHVVMGFLAMASDHDRVAARKWFDEAAQLDPQSYAADFGAAEFDRVDPAASASVEAHLRQCIKVQPHMAAAYNDLADLFVTQNRNLDEAHMLTIQAVELEPQILVYRYTAAEVLEAQHNYDNALAVLAEARDRVAKLPAQIAEIDRRMTRVRAEQASAAAQTPATAVAPSPGS